MRKGTLTKLAAISAAAVMAFSSMTVFADDSIYVTEKGDNLSKIAQKVYGDKARWREIYEANRDQIKDPNKLWVNQQLVIPGAAVESPQPAVPQPVIPQDMPSQWETSAEWQAASAAGQSYVEQNGLQFYQGTAYQTQGYRYNKDNLARYEFIGVDGAVTGITVRDAEKEGYQVVTISHAASGSTATYYNWEQDVYDELTSLSFPGMDLYDIYTGKALPNASTMGDVELVNSAVLSWGGISYDIDYIKEVTWDEGEWSDWYGYIEDVDVSYKLWTANITVTTVIPKGYDGLALRVIPSTEGPEPDEEYNVFDNDKEKYILDGWKDGSYLMRVSDLYNILNAQ